MFGEDKLYTKVILLNEIYNFVLVDIIFLKLFWCQNIWFTRLYRVNTKGIYIHIVKSQVSV